MKQKSEKKGSARKADGNITIDLGEAIEKKLGTAGMSGGKMAPRRPGGYRPGMFGSYRPWYASARQGGPSLGAKLGLPESVNVGDNLTGIFLGTAANRVLNWVVPRVLNTDSALAVNAANFGLGLIPYLAKKNGLTVGVATPGLIYLAGSIVDWALEKSQLLGARPMLSGVSRPSASDAAAARQKLADLQSKLSRHGAPGSVPRVQAQYVG